MKTNDPELAKIESEQKRLEIERLLGEIRSKTAKVPPSVINGSHGKAVDFKAAAAKGLSLLRSSRPTLSKARECVSELARFW